MPRSRASNTETLARLLCGLCCALALSLPAAVRGNISDNPAGFFHMALKQRGAAIELDPKLSMTPPQGSYESAVPLDLPAPRGELQLSLRVGYVGGHEVGEAGVGWAIAPWYLHISTSTRRRKPARASGNVPPRVEAFLGGNKLLMNPTGTAGVYRPLVASAYHRLHGPMTRGGKTTWLLHDAKGTEYVFQPLAGLGTSVVLYLTKVIDRTRKNTLRLSYTLDHHTYCTSGAPAHPDVLLTRVAYSFSGAGCPKHVIDLSYRTWAFDGQTGAHCDNRTILGTTADDGFFRSRMQILDRIRIYSATTTSCAAEGTDGKALLRTYNFHYQADAETRQPRLTEVRRLGRGQTSASSALPAASYGYGTALSSSGGYSYGQPRTVYLPPGLPGVDAAINASSSSSTFGPFSAPQLLQDITGDGLADVVYRTSAGYVVQANRTTKGGTSLTTASKRFALDSDGALTLFEQQASGSDAHPKAAQDLSTWRSTMDFNGDGRPDILRAVAGAPYSFTVFLNTPYSAADPGRITWVRRTVNVAAINSELTSRGLLTSTRFPLERSRADVVKVEAGLPISRPVVNRIRAEWKLLDVNGDGLLDFVFNASKLVADAANSYRHCVGVGGLNTDVKCTLLIPFKYAKTNHLRVFYNTSFGSALSFAKTSTKLLGGGGLEPCGVEGFYEGGPKDSREGERWRMCGLQEVNGDGALDFVHAQLLRSARFGHGIHAVWLGNGRPMGFVAAAKLTLPGPLDWSYSLKPGSCTVSSKVTSRTLSALKDLNGDGLSDYIRFQPASAGAWNGSGSFVVHLNTGYGFTAAHPITAAVGFEIRRTERGCKGYLTRTLKSLTDLNGDGRPDLVVAKGSDSARRLEVWQLLDTASRPGAHDAGRLVLEGNGYGSQTRIRYGSAKEDATTLHQLPNPEIVIFETEKIAARGLGTSLAPVRYAWGDALQVYDALFARWTFRGYGRRVVLRRTVRELAQGRTTAGGSAEIFDAVRSTEAKPGYEQYALVGKVRQVGRLEGIFSTEPRDLLGVDLSSDWRRRAGVSILHKATSSTHYVPGWSTSECYEPLDPYGAQLPSSDTYLCGRAGITYIAAQSTWRGAAAPPSSAATQTRSYVCSVNALGQPLLVYNQNDTARLDDEICERFTYASSSGDPSQPVLSLVQTHRRTDCGVRPTYKPVGQATASKATTAKASTTSTLPPKYSAAVPVNDLSNSPCAALGSSERTLWGVRSRYDGLPAGQVDRGLESHRFIERHEVKSGAKLGDYEAYQQSHDPYGNVVVHKTQRADGVIRVSTSKYDDFGMVVETLIRSASGAAANLITTTLHDPVLLLPKVVTDPNSVQRKYAYDPHGRVTSEWIVTQPSNKQHQLRKLAYYDDPYAPHGRWVLTQTLHGRPEADGAAAAGTVLKTWTKTYLDEFGRRRLVEAGLGADYSSKILIREHVVHDALGRVAFAADPYEKGAAAGKRYGTSYHYDLAGRVQLSIRGEGQQPPVWTANPAQDLYPTRYAYLYSGRQRVQRNYGPNELSAGHVEQGAYDEKRTTALGRVVEVARRKGGTLLERATYAHDRLGHQISMTRFKDPAASSVAVTWSFSYDSLGRLIRIQEPGVATKARAYDRWGKLTGESWLDASSSPVIQRAALRSYDGFGRAVKKWMTEDGVPVPGSQSEFFYDAPSGAAAQQEPYNLKGRLSYAKDATRATFFGYDAFGRKREVARVLASDGRRFAVRRRHLTSGLLDALAFWLPDGAQREKVSYAYDSAGRMKQVTFSDNTLSFELFKAQTIDLFGRHRHVQFGNGVTDLYTYRADRRRELQGHVVQSVGRSDKISYKGYDGEGQLAARKEVVQVTSSSWSVPITRASAYSYDALGRLQRSRTTTSAFYYSMVTSDETFGYDALGNVTKITDAFGAKSLELTPTTGDPDRLCNAVKPGAPSPSGCAYSYGPLGNVREIAGPTKREFYYDAGSRLVAMVNDTHHAALLYDAFGALAETRFSLADSGVTHVDRKLGPLVEEARFGAAVQIERRVPGPRGKIIATRRGRGPGATTLYWHGGLGGNRLFSGAGGTIVQEVGYRPYGGVTKDTAPLGSAGRTKYQWNRGETFSAFGVTRLGPRIYDPRLGRFLQRDPLILTSSAGRANPYAFAYNDPVNWGDPSGLKPKKEIETGDDSWGELFDRVFERQEDLVELLELQEEARQEAAKWDRDAKIALDSSRERALSERLDQLEAEKPPSPLYSVGKAGLSIGKAIANPSPTSRGKAAYDGVKAFKKVAAYKRNKRAWDKKVKKTRKAYDKERKKRRQAGRRAKQHARKWNSLVNQARAIEARTPEDEVDLSTNDYWEGW